MATLDESKAELKEPATEAKVITVVKTFSPTEAEESPHTSINPVTELIAAPTALIAEMEAVNPEAKSTFTLPKLFSSPSRS